MDCVGGVIYWGPYDDDDEDDESYGKSWQATHAGS